MSRRIRYATNKKKKTLTSEPVRLPPAVSGHAGGMTGRFTPLPEGGRGVKGGIML